MKRLRMKFILGGVLFTTLAVLAGSWLHNVIMAFGIVAPWDFLFTLPFFLLIILVPLWIALDCWIFRPLNSITEANIQVAQGNLEAATISDRPMPKDEIGELMHSRNKMLKLLLDHQLSLEEKNIHLLEELRKLDATLEERVHQRTFELQVLYDLSQQIGYTLNYEELFRLMLYHLHRAIAYDVAASFMEADSSWEIFIRPISSLSPAIKEEIKELLCRTFTQLTGRTINLDQGKSWEMKPEEFDETSFPLTHLSSIFQVPFIVEKKTLGLFLVGAEKEGQFSEEQIRLLYAVANQVSISIQRLRALLAAEQRRLESLVEHMPEGVALLASDFRILIANPLATDYLTMLADARVGDVLTHLDGQPFENILKLLREKQPHELIVEGSPPQVFEVKCTRIEEERRESGEYVLVIHEVTEERGMRRRIELQERLAAIGHLAAGIAHDFNNVLNVVIGFSDILKRNPDMPEFAKEQLELITEQGWRGAKLIRQILDFSRRSATEKLPLELIPFLKEMVKLLERIIPENIKIIFEFEPREYIVNVDLTQIQQIITNLAVNATDAMPVGGELRMRLSSFELKPDVHPFFQDMPSGDWIVLSVSDTGTGIKERHLSHIFEPFFTTKEAGKGTGLGLAQVYGLVKLHNGFIDVESKVDKGTTFTIYLPAGVEERKRKVVEGALEKLDRGKGDMILLVEDEQAVLEVEKEFLELLGYGVLTARNGKEALEVYKQERDRIKLVITDMIMPEMGGLSLVQALREQGYQTKVVVASGYPLKEEWERIWGEDIANWLQKPFTQATLAQVVSQALKEEE